MSKRSLTDARLYLCTDSRRRQGDLVQFLDAVLAAGVDVVQLREKNLEAAEELDLLAVFGDACRRHGALLAVNDRADLAVTAGADVLHVGQDDLSPAQARRIVGPDVLIGLSSHSIEQAAGARANPDVDYFCVGPIWPTPTKLGRPGIGLAPVGEVAASRPDRPWFAIGGVDEANLDQVLATGASRVVVVRALTEADDPGAAAGRIAGRLAGAVSTRG
ncbi:MAG TPA: thiamine phosphate synthase [Jatrophihabitans sp.]|nr:thiamine phosphate synthase [Jatrophihabitans sp.]